MRTRADAPLPHLAGVHAEGLARDGGLDGGVVAQAQGIVARSPGLRALCRYDDVERALLHMNVADTDGKHIAIEEFVSFFSLTGELATWNNLLDEPETNSNSQDK